MEPRRLAAILAADVAGYSRLMGADEDGTLAQLKAHRRAFVDPKIKEHHGKIVKTTGDGMLVEFTAVIEALRCAVEVQRGMAERNAGVPQHKRIEFRIGINLGDIIHDEKDIFGDGVNVAARLESIAEPGGICISRSVRDPVLDKLGFTFEDIGEQALKNIAAPVHAYRVRFGEHPETQSKIPASRHTGARFGPRVLALALGSAIAAAALVVWLGRPPSATISVHNAPLPPPDKPSIAVLPFANIGGDAKQGRLADGMTDDVITDLSRFRQLFVIASYTMSTYKGKSESVQGLGHELGVRYVLYGSIQTNENRVRVTARLIDAATAADVWSERYERTLDDIFDVQNEVTQKIAAALGGATGSVLAAEAEMVRRKPPSNLRAYDYYVMGLELHYRFTKDAVAKAKEQLQKAIESDPHFARAYSALADVYDTLGWGGWGDEQPATLFEKGRAAALEGVALDPTDADGHQILGQIYVDFSEFDQAFVEFEKAYALNPNDPDVLVRYGGNLYILGRSEEGAEMMQRAYRLNPRYPPFYNFFADPFYVTGRYEQVIKMTHAQGGEPVPWSSMLMAMSYAQLDRKAEAEAAAANLKKRYVDFSLEHLLSDLGGIKDEPTLEKYFEGVRKAGLLECAKKEDLAKYPQMKHLAFCDAKRATN